MADLTSKRRKALPASEFGEPKKRAYPIPDRSHAANAKARASEEVKKGNLSPSAAAKIDAKANRVLGHRGSEASDRKGPDMEKTSAGTKRGWYGAKPKPEQGGKKMHMAKEGEVKHVVRDKKEPMKERKEHERAGMKKEMEHKKLAKEHESKGMKKAMEHKEEKKMEHEGPKRGTHRTIHIHGGTHTHHHHHGKMD